MALVNGKDFLVSDSNGIAAFAKSCEVVTTAEMIPVTDAAEGDYEHYKKGRKGWTVNVDCLYVSGKNWLGLLSSGQRAQLMFQVGSDQSSRVYGYAWCEGYRIVGQVGNLTKCSAQFRGDGAFRATPT